MTDGDRVLDLVWGRQAVNRGRPKDYRRKVVAVQYAIPRCVIIKVMLNINVSRPIQQIPRSRSIITETVNKTSKDNLLIKFLGTRLAAFGKACGAGVVLLPCSG